MTMTAAPDCTQCGWSQAEAHLHARIAELEAETARLQSENDELVAGLVAEREARAPWDVDIRTHAILGLVLAELARATEKHGPLPSFAVGLAAIMEEAGELAQAILQGQPDTRLVEEASQIGTLAIRFIYDLCAISESPATQNQPEPPVAQASTPVAVPPPAWWSSWSHAAIAEAIAHYQDPMALASLLTTLAQEIDLRCAPSQCVQCETRNHSDAHDLFRGCPKTRAELAAVAFTVLAAQSPETVAQVRNLCSTHFDPTSGTGVPPVAVPPSPEESIQ